MEPGRKPIAEKEKTVKSLLPIFLGLLLVSFCSKKADPKEILKYGKIYPDVLCEKIETCARLELDQLGPKERSEVLKYLPKKEECLEAQAESKVLPTDSHDPMVSEITEDRLKQVIRCVEGIRNASCDELEESYSIPGCQGLYDIGEFSEEP
jgi:hypothetical protein